ncbi:WD40-repeat-containing domain [Pseudocohnilembus persalinus]|uniref:WD40-repeat-containing domain n=1 Tax=Pseudocohnilembus persalinus TaxID=266149 RepID=A0A0V0QGW3_PSEPJ|nr:WD40-repeat-containing domain [Pseudocohnilembus persalinus]|eukprot:KRX01396.1 WD40-repeat-containing domain [Pseudocohnilembus persalinus]
MSESIISKQSEQEDFLKFKINNLAKPKNNQKKLKPISQIKNTLSLFKKKDYQNEVLDKSIIDSNDYLEEQDDFQYNEGKKIFKKLPPLSRNHVKLKDNEIFIELRIHENQNFHNVLKSYKDEINKYFFNKYGKVFILGNPIYITEKQKQVILVNLKKTDNSEALETDLIDKIYETFKKGQQKLKNIEFKSIYRQDIKPEDLEVDNLSKNEIKNIENSQIVRKSQEAGVGKSSFLDKFLIPMQNQEELNQEQEYKKNTKIYRYLQEEIQKNQDKNKNTHFFLIKLLYFNSMDHIQDRVQLLYNSVQDPQKDKIVFLVDGYNEFPMEKFDVVDVFLLEQFPQNKVILTSRTKYLTQSQIPLLFTFDNNIKGSLLKIKCVFMQRFYDFQVEKFIDLHLRNVAEINDKQQLLTQIKIIVQKFQFSRQAKELSRIPLYLRIFLDSYQDVYNKINKKFKLNEELTEKQQEYDSQMFQYNMRIAQINEQLKKLELNLKGQYYIESEQSQFSKEASDTKLFNIIFPVSLEQKSDQQYESSLQTLEQTQKPFNLENVWEYQKSKLTSQKNSSQQNSKINQNNHVGRNIQVSKSLYINQSLNKEVQNLSKIDYQNDLDDFSEKDGISSNFSDPYSIQEHQLKQNALNKALKIASKQKIFQDGQKFPKLQKDITEYIGQDEKENQTNLKQSEKNQKNQFIDYSQIKEQKIKEYQEKEKQIDIKQQQLLGIINKKEQSITQRQDIQLIEKRLEIKEQIKKLELEKEEIKLKQVDLGQNLFEINQKNQHQKVNTEDIIQLRNKSFSRYYLYGKYIKKWIKQRIQIMGENQKQIILANIMKDNKQNKIFDEINIYLKNDYKLQQEGLSKNDDLLYKLCYGFNKKLITELFKDEKLTWTQEFIKNNFWKTNKDFLGNLKTQMKKIGDRIKGLFKQKNNEDTEQPENQLQNNNLNKDKSQTQQYYEEIQILINLSPFNEHIDGQADEIINEIISEIEQDILKIDSFLDIVRQKLILEKIQIQKDEKAKIEQRYQNKLMQKFQQKSEKNIQTPISSKTDLMKQEKILKIAKNNKDKLFALSTNAATIYNAVNFSFSGKDLRNFSMEAALLQQSFFMGSILQGADLDFAYFYDANLNYANLNDTKMNEIQLGRPQEYIGHKSPVLSTTIIQQQRLQMASGDQQGYIKIWDIQTGENKLQLNGHLGGVYALDSSKDGQFLVSGGADKIIKLWDLQTNTVVRQVKAHKFTVVSVRFSNDNMHIISGGMYLFISD